MLNLSNQIIIPQPSVIGKSDISFCRAYEYVKGNYIKLNVIHLIKCFMFIIYIPIDYSLLGADNNLITAAMALGLTISLISALYYFTCICKMFTNVQQFVSAAALTGHSTEQKIQNYDSLDSVTSKTVFYQAYNLNISQIPPNTINTYIRSITSDVDHFKGLKHNCLDNLQALVSFCALGSLIFAIIAVSKQSNANVGQIIVISLYIVLEAISKPKIMFILIFLAISPIICFFCCIFACCCSNTNGRYMGVPQTEATMKDIVESGGQCSICLQAFLNKQKVYILPCSTKHMFHVGCLDKWMRVKDTCPSCRAQIPTTNNIIPPE